MKRPAVGLSSICAFFIVYTWVLVSLVSGFPLKEGPDSPQLRFVDQIDRFKVGFNWHNVSCAVCKAIFITVDIALLSNTNTERVAHAVEEACARLHLADPHVCRDITQLFREDFIRALQESFLWPSEACALLVGPACGHFDIYAPWNVSLSRVPKPPVTPPTPPKPGSPQSRILFLTDIHWDAVYAEGSVANCNEPLCCRNESGRASWKHNGAGHWGTYGKCDVPLRTVENLLQNVAKSGPWDWVYWTGDIPAHNVWSQTRAQQLNELITISRLLRKYLGPNVNVYPAVGNHESTPVNSFPPPFVHGNRSSHWLYDTMAEEWAPWLPAGALKTIRHGGFYTAEVQPGLRVVSLNMNFCARENFWLMVNSTDPADQLQWLVHILQESENKGEKVHIIGHIPPGLCLSSWSRNYYHIVNRYESTISGQFFGHTHTDEFQMFYDEDTLTRPLGVAFIAPSVTTYVNLNPGYRVYYTDGNYPNSSRMVLDHETFILNLTLANNLSNGPALPSKPDPNPSWTLLYRASEAYGLSTLFPSDFENLIKVFLNDDRVFKRFWYLYHKGHVSEPCKDTCKTAHICFLRSGRYDLLTQCDVLRGANEEIVRSVRKTMC
ncbi:sphingomyelin phosphodiesterase [Triplophysa rosa]|uniref:Sphingomyelin phosphodiesterase n=1 Tax=Triplophysa rosa TaxID=992332 RepID=A0A9W7WAR1_TRIRA|nr:sphingomyelin phosphodiesterase [Triplophysa rosa]KAI7793261.1 putative sphingomyelin phosphodiesterase [Triplophysa rosa]